MHRPPAIAQHILRERSAYHLAKHRTQSRRRSGVADWRDEFVRGGGAATHKFILGLSNAGDRLPTETKMAMHPYSFGRFPRSSAGDAGGGGSGGFCKIAIIWSIT
jgi:hypothetical protein